MPDLEFKLKPSRQYLILLISFLILSLWVAVMLPVSLWIRFAVAGLAAGYGAILLWQAGLLRAKTSIVSMRRLENGNWFLSTRSLQYEAEIRGDSTVTNQVSVLRFQPLQRWRPVSCVIFRDALPPEDYRRLVVVLRMH